MRDGMKGLEWLGRSAVRCVALLVLLAGCELDERRLGTETQSMFANEPANVGGAAGDGAAPDRVSENSSADAMLDGAASGMGPDCVAQEGCDCGPDGSLCPPDTLPAPPPNCDGCVIDGQCLSAGLTKPDDPCLICDPALDASAWSASANSCDDGNFCTVDDTCQGGVCLGARARNCEDGATCNGISICDPGSESCSAPVSQCGANAICDVLSDQCVNTCAGCVIAGSCVVVGSEQPGNTCMVCDPSRSMTAYTGAAGKACGAVESACSLQDTCSAAGECLPNNAAAGTPCGDQRTSTCNQADSCDGAGNCLARLAANQTGCEDGNFCTVGDACQGGLCVAGGPFSCGSGLTCNETNNRCQCNGCQIGNTCVASGALNGADPCQICDPSRSATGYSTNTMRAGCACVAVPANIVAWWPGEGNAQDRQGNADGSIEGNVTFARGIVGQAFVFDGIDSGINLGDVSQFDLTTGSNLTVEGWVLYRGATAADGEFITAFNYGCTAEEQSVVFVNDGFISIETRDADRNLSDAVASTPFPLDAFHHFAATRSVTADGANLSLYVDGEIVARAPDIATSTFATTADDYIGKRFPCSDVSAMNGLVDELSVYSRALSQNEIRGIFRAGAAGKCR
jgi:hypothetical protein